MEIIDIERKTGLKPEDISLLRQIIFSHPTVEDAILFGSRAKGEWKKFSDIDISLIGENITHTDLIKIIMEIEDTDLPYTVDIIRFASITNPALTDHIQRVGISLRDMG